MQEFIRFSTKSLQRKKKTCLNNANCTAYKSHAGLLEAQADDFTSINLILITFSTTSRSREPRRCCSAFSFRFSVLHLNGEGATAGRTPCNRRRIARIILLIGLLCMFFLAKPRMYHRGPAVFINVVFAFDFSITAPTVMDPPLNWTKNISFAPS